MVDLAGTGARRFAYPVLATGYIGWTYAENLGDDAMLEAASLLVPDDCIECFRGVRREALLARFRLSGPAMFKRIFLGGGTLINRGYLDTMREALRLGVPVSTLGTGVGGSGFSAADESIPKEWGDLLSRCRKVGVRGPRSRDKLEAIGVAGTQVVGDLALALTPDLPIADPLSRRFLLNAAAMRGANHDFDFETVLGEVARATRRLTELGWTAVPVAMCEDDVEPITCVLRSAGIVCGPIARPRSADDFFVLARGAAMSVGVRLHCAVLSSCAGVAPLAVAYRDKGSDFAESMELVPWMIRLDELRAGSLAERAEALASTAGDVGRDAHAKALGWRGELRRYIVDA